MSNTSILEKFSPLIKVGDEFSGKMQEDENEDAENKITAVS